MRSKKIKIFGVTTYLQLGAGLLIAALIGIFVFRYYNDVKSNVLYSYDELKSRNIVISDQEIYDFMNIALLNGDSLRTDKREFLKLNCFTITHDSYMAKFISSQADTVLTAQDKTFMKSQITNQKYLWDKDKLVNVWCITPQDISKIKKDKAYWENFRKQFGKYGHHYYSIPIFSKDRNTVIIEHSGSGDWLLGSGSISIYKKINGNWQFIKSETLWIS